MEHLLESDVEFARFLAEAEHRANDNPWHLRPLSIPTIVYDRRAYDEETEQYLRFIRGQRINNPKGQAA